MGAFSYALDLTEGQPPGHSLRSARIALRVASELGLSDEDRRTIFYATLLKDLGCSSNAARVAEVYLTDDRSFKHDFKLIGDGIGPALRFVLAKTGRTERLGKRASAVLNILRNGPEIVRSMIETRCTRGAEIVRLLRFPEPVAAGVYSLDEHWDGGGKPVGLSGHDIPLASRMALLAQVAEVFFTNAGPAAARSEIARLAGKWLDPELCAAFASACGSDAFWQDLASTDLQGEPGGLLQDEARIRVDEDYLDDIAAAFGQVIDAKSPYTAGHSERVGDYAATIAERMGLDCSEIRSLRRAAMLHDVGKLGVSNTILDKPGKLDDGEWTLMRGHAAQTAEILARVAPLREMAMIAASHHERLDGKGYPLGLDDQVISLETRIISVCDFFDALTADRPYRDALPVERALAIMREEAGAAIDVRCLEVLESEVLRG